MVRRKRGSFDALFRVMGVDVALALERAAECLGDGIKSETDAWEMD